VFIFSRKRLLWALLSLVAAISLLSLNQALAQPLSVRVDRWLGLRQMGGTVTLVQAANTRVARVGDRLRAVGDGIRTAPASTATLEVDTGIGFIDVSENTDIRIQALAVAPDNGRITRLQVIQRQARLRLRPFTNRGSELELQTPAGTAAVRGTEFGVAVQPDGKMGLATLSGAVETEAQGQQVHVPGGYQNLIFPGEPPTTPEPIRDNTEISYQLEYFFQGSTRFVRLIGRVDPVNTVFIGNQPQPIDRNGEFSLPLLATARLTLDVTVVTPLGTRTTHALRLL
jgi:hypothetical protein